MRTHSFVALKNMPMPRNLKERRLRLDRPSYYCRTASISPIWQTQFAILLYSPSKVLNWLSPRLWRKESGVTCLPRTSGGTHSRFCRLECYHNHDSRPFRLHCHASISRCDATLEQEQSDGSVHLPYWLYLSSNVGIRSELDLSRSRSRIQAKFGVFNAFFEILFLWPTKFSIFFRITKIWKTSAMYVGEHNQGV